MTDFQVDRIEGYVGEAAKRSFSKGCKLLVEFSEALGRMYGWYGEKTRENEGRRDVNAILFNKDRLELLDAKTLPYEDDHYQNKFTYCLFRDRKSGVEFAALNTKLTWGDPDRRLREAMQLNQFTTELPNSLPVVVIGDFNTFPFLQHEQDLYFDGKYVERALKGSNLEDARWVSAYGHFGPLCSITNSKTTLQPFKGPECTGFICRAEKPGRSRPG